MEAEERLLLDLLKDVQCVLADSLKTLDKTTLLTRESAYLGRAAAPMINRVAEGYIFLRDAGLSAASKLLVRPPMEAVFTAISVMNIPGFLFRKAYTELQEEKKLFTRKADSPLKFDQDVEELKRTYQRLHPGLPSDIKKVTIRETAELAGKLSSYEGAYRIYCQFSHGSLQAALGHWDEMTDPHDSSVMVGCVLTILSLLKTHTKAHVPNLRPFVERFERLSQNTSNGQRRNGRCEENFHRLICPRRQRAAQGAFCVQSNNSVRPNER